MRFWQLLIDFYETGSPDVWRAKQTRKFSLGGVGALVALTGGWLCVTLNLAPTSA